MGQLFVGWRFALRRFRANWWLMLLVGIGALLATTLLASAPIYTRSLSDIGLRFRLDQGLNQPRERIAAVSAEGLVLGDPVGEGQRAAMDTIAEARVGWLGHELLIEERSRELEADFPAPSVPGRAWPARLVYLSGFEDHVEVVAGRLPGPSSGTAEVVLPDGLQREASLGDVIELRDRSYDDCRRLPPSDDPLIAADEVLCVPTTFVTNSAAATVVGFVRPIDPADLRWQLFRDGWAVPDEPPTPGLPAREGQGPIALLTTREQYFGAFTQRFPEMTTSHRTAVAPDLDALAVEDVPRAIDDLAAWTRDLREGVGIPVGGSTEFADELARFRNLQTFSEVPLLLILLQVTGVVAFYIVALMAAVHERQAEEVAVLRSRGASAVQILGLALVEGLLLAVPAAILGPWLAARAIATLGRTPAFEPLTGGAALPAAVSNDAVLLGAAGAALVLVSMLLPTLLASGRGILDERREQARPPGRSVLQRTYLDLGAVVAAAVLLWQLDRRGTVFDPASVGGWSADPLLLASPLVLTVAAAAIVLRAYPLVLRTVARVARPLRGTSILLGVGRAGREPGTTGRLVLLLSMAAAVGTFAASYGPTVDRSLDERARYETGVDVRGTIVDFDARDTPAALGDVRAIDGVKSATLVRRGTITTLSGSHLDLLAVEDPEVAAAALWFRDDFAVEPMPDLLDRIESAIPPGGGLVLPDDAVALEVEAFTEQQPRIGRITARLRDADGLTHDILLSSIEPGTWTAIRADLPERAPRPLKLIALHLKDLDVIGKGDGALYFDDVSAIGPDGERTLLEGFEDGFDWTMYAQRASRESFALADDVAHDGEHAMRWTWTREVYRRERLLALRDPAAPLPAILSRGALAALGAQPGDRASVLLGNGFEVPIAVQGSAELFPTLDPGGGFVVVGLEPLRSLAGILGAARDVESNELWVDLDDALPVARRQEIVALLADPEASPLPLRNVVDQAANLDAVAADPTLQASGSGILLLAFGAALSAALLGLVVTIAMSLRRRVTEFAVLRSLGSSPGAILRALLLEWGVVLVLGAAIGVLLGRQIASLMLRFLEVTEDGGRVVPAFVLETDWALVAGGLAVVVASAGLALWGSWRLALRRAGAAALRLTQ